MRGQHRRDQRCIEQRRNRFAVDPVGLQRLERRGDGGFGLGGDTLPVFREIREHRKQHEAAHKGDRVVEAERIEPRIDRLGPRDPAMPVDARRADIFGLAEQFVAAIGANDVAEDPPQIADVGILRDLDRWAHGPNLLHLRRCRVKPRIAMRGLFQFVLTRVSMPISITRRPSNATELRVSVMNISRPEASLIRADTA